MTHEQVIKIIKYLIIAWLIMSVICGAAYIALALIVIESFNQLGTMIK